MQNVLADLLLVGTYDSGAWMLARPWATHIFALYSQPFVDMFASAADTQLPTFVSHYPPLTASSLDALSFLWTCPTMYGFPLRALFTVLRRLQNTPVNLARGAVLTKPAAVSASSLATPRPTVPVSTGTGSPHTRQHGHSSPGRSVPSTSCVVSVRSIFQAAGFSAEAADIAAAARRPGTLKTYDSRLERYYTWGDEKALDPMEMFTSDLTSFFCDLFWEGKQIR